MKFDHYPVVLTAALLNPHLSPRGLVVPSKSVAACGFTSGSAEVFEVL